MLVWILNRMKNKATTKLPNNAKMKLSGKKGRDFDMNGDSDNIRLSGGEESQVYCVCRSVSFGEMIGCDNPECALEWFHMGCVGLSRKPTGKWYCPDCAVELDKTDLRGTRSKSASANGTYCDMIIYSLNHLPRKQGTFEEVCGVIEKEFYEGLNWRLESHIKRSPVWTTFVKNQLEANEKFTLLNPKRGIYGFSS
jgi:hypothetical protein